MILELFEQNSLICPIAIVAAYGGSSYDDHRVSMSCCIRNFRSNASTVGRHFNTGLHE